MTDLRTRLLAELDRREQVAIEAADDDGPVWIAEQTPTGIKLFANDGPYIGGSSLDDAKTVHVALCDPADALRRYSHYRRVLDRHQVGPDGALCNVCFRPDGYLEPEAWPCPEICGVADALGIPIEEPTANG